MGADLSVIVKDVFSDSFEEVTSEYIQTKDMVIRWIRSGVQMHVMVSDYLKDAPESIVRDALRVFKDTLLADGNAAYSAEFVEYLTSDKFRTRNLPVFLARHNAVPDSRIGELAQELVEEGAVRSIDGITFRSAEINKASSLFRTVLVCPNVLHYLKDQAKATIYAGIMRATCPFDAKVKPTFEECVSAYLDFLDGKEAE